MEALVSRSPVIVKRVDADSLQSFTELWVASRVEQGTSIEVASRAASEGRLAHALQRPEVRAYLATANQASLGFAVMSHAPISCLSESPCVAIDQIYVVPSARHHGVARHLLAAVTAYAEKVGSEQIVSYVPAQLRDANRFFARLGFSSTSVRRITSTALLRRRLSSGDLPRHSLDQVLIRRRSLRSRAGLR
jgi:GNAT superfamily N-acetyltransferase